MVTSFDSHEFFEFRLSLLEVFLLLNFVSPDNGGLILWRNSSEDFYMIAEIWLKLVQEVIIHCIYISLFIYFIVS